MSDRVRPTLRGIVVGDGPTAWRAAGLPVVGDRATVGGVTLRFAGTSGPRGVLGWELDPAVPDAVDGLPTAEAGPAVTPTDGAPAITAVDHLVVATPDLERTTAALATIGLRPRRTVEAARGDHGTSYRFFLLGTSLLELIGPTTPTGDGPARFAGVALTATELATLPAVTGPPKPAVQPGREIVTVPTRELGISVPLAILSPRAPRPGPR